MPRIKPRRGRFQVGHAIAAGINGYRGGKAEAEQAGRLQREEARHQARYDQAHQIARRGEAETNAAREYLIGQAEVKRQEQQAELDKSGFSGIQSTEEMNKRRVEIQDGFNRIKAMSRVLDPEETAALLDEYAKGQRTQILAEEFKAIDDEISGLERNETFPMPPEIAKGLREGLAEGASPNEVNRAIKQFKQGAGDTMAQRSKVERGMAQGQDYLQSARIDPNVSERNYQAAESLMYQWSMSPRQSIAELMGAIQAASYGVSQRGWDPTKPAVKQVPVPMPAEQQGEVPFADRSPAERMEFLKQLNDAPGR